MRDGCPRSRSQPSRADSTFTDSYCLGQSWDIFPHRMAAVVAPAAARAGLAGLLGGVLVAVVLYRNAVGRFERYSPV
ncbi:hypothetical protein ACFQH2_06550 [Natronoarchaeum sp. GCM10025703]|uniref:hypothetical protein n=1 Tax=unclassified Natronoarchaeum TaxID=2620183 RepID=UPI0036128748